jgi:hypothetical protein
MVHAERPSPVVPFRPVAATFVPPRQPGRRISASPGSPSSGRPDSRTSSTPRVRSTPLIWDIETADVNGEFARLKAAGAIVVREPYGFDEQPGSAIATLADPDDNDFQLMTPMSPEPAG